MPIDCNLKIDGVDGESAHKDHKGEIEVLAWSWAVTQPSTSGIGGGAGKGKAQPASLQWTHAYDKSPNWGGMLVTGGGVVFSGGTSDRKFHAFDATTGKLLWEFPTNSGILAPPTTFRVDGKQYVAVESGWGGDSRGMQATLNRLFPGEYPEVPEGGAVWVFALE